MGVGKDRTSLTHVREQKRTLSVPLRYHQPKQHNTVFIVHDEAVNQAATTATYRECRHP